MYKSGDVVVYPGTGVCKIVDIITQKFARTEEKTYYVLKPLYDNADTTVYCPVDNCNIKIRKLLSEGDVTLLIREAESSESLWIENDNERKKAFASIVKEDDRVKLLRLIIELHTKRIEKEKEGKKLHLSDEKILHQAEKVIHEELACTMGMSVEDVAAFVMKEMNIEV